MTEKRKFHIAAPFRQGLCIRSGFYTDKEYEEECMKTYEYFITVLKRYDNLPWYKKILIAYPFSPFSIRINSIYNPI